MSSGPFGSCLALVVALCLVFAAPDAHAQRYSFTKIAETTGSYAGFEMAVMNEQGVVAFIADDLSVPGTMVILKGNGGLLSTAAAGLGGSSVLADINDGGTVAFLDGELYTTSGLPAPPTPIALAHGALILDQVSVAPGGLANTGHVLFVDQASPRRLLLGSGGPLATLLEETPDLSPFAFPTANASNVVAFVGLTSSGEFAVHKVELGGTAPIAVPPFELRGAPAIQDQGFVVFPGVDANGVVGIFAGNGGQLSTVIDTTTSPFLGFSGAVANQAGTVAFLGTLAGGVRGVFTGPDPVLDKVIQLGDPLFGSFVGRIDGHTWAGERLALNNAGQIAFIVGLADGRQVVVRADPAAPSNQPPVVANPGPQSTPEDQAVVLQIAAGDPDGDPLTYAAPPAAVGTTSGLPPGLSIDPQTGVISGAPGPGTAGTVYTVGVTVSDGVASTSVTFTWTVTDPAPRPRSGLTATPDFVDNVIALAWQNPNPDIAATIEVRAAFAGDPEPYPVVASLGPGATTYDYQPPQGQQLFCFRITAVSAQVVRSAPSNQACATSPFLEIQNLQASPAATGATLTWTTTMPATTIATLTPPAPGATIALVPDANQMGFTWTATDLAAATTYTVDLAAESILAPQLAFASIQFTTGPAPTLDARIAGQAEQLGVSQGQATIKINVVLTNPAAQTVALSNIAVDPRTTLDVPCPPASNRCTQTFVRVPLVPPPSGNPTGALTLQPGQSATVALHFLVEQWILQGVSGNQAVAGNFSSQLNLVVDFQHPAPTGPISREVELALRVLMAGPAADLSVGMIAAPMRLESLPVDVAYNVFVENRGPDDANGVRVIVTLPPHTRFVSSEGDFRCRDQNGGPQVICDSAGTVVAGGGIPTFTVNTRVEGIVGGVVGASAVVFGREPDPNPENNSGVAVSTFGFPVGGDADLSVTVEARPHPTERLRIRYTITVTNHGPEGVVGVVVWYVLPQRLAMLGTPSVGSVGLCDNRFNQEEQCTLGLLEPGETDTISFGVRAHGPGEYPVTVAISGAGPDPRPENNVTATTTVLEP